MATPLTDDIVVDNFPAAQRSMRIAYVTETYPPEINGVAMSTARLVDGLQRRNHEVQLIRPRQDGQAAAPTSPGFQEILTRGLPIPRYPHLRMGAPSKRALVRLWSLRRPDVVHMATEGPICWSAMQAAGHLKILTTSDFRTNFHAYSKHYGVGWLHRPIMAYLRKFHNRTRCTMVPTESLRRELAAAGFANLAVVSRGVDTQQFAPAHRSQALRAQWGAGPDDLVVLCVGRVAPEKNLEALAAAFDVVQAQDPRARLVIVGDGPMRAELQQRCPQACFAGQRSGQDLAAHYASADVFAFASLTETFGNVTAEALASGLAVVAFDYAAAAQLIRQGENGVLIPFGDNAGFVHGLAELARDAPRRRALADRARASAHGLDWEGVALRFESVLSGLLDQSVERIVEHSSRVTSLRA